MKKFIKNSIPYLVILCLSILGTYIVFYKGVVPGDDIYFHLGNIMDQYLTIKEGDLFSKISSNLAMGLGVGNRLFYSPLPHLTVSIITLFLKVFNCSMLTSFKITIVLSVFVSGVFMYRFALKFSKNNVVASLIAAACYVLYPYRMFDAFCRAAFAEAYSFIFIPLFFNGLYGIVSFKDKVSILPFVKIILGGSLLYLSHNITALYTYIAGFIFLIVNVKSIVKSLKLNRYIVYSLSSVFLLIGIASIILFSQFELLNMNYYNISDDVRMWTNVEEVITRTHEEFNYSGFINAPYLISRYPSIYSWSSILIHIIMYIVSAIVFVIFDVALSETKVFKKLHWLLSIPLSFLLVSLVSATIESYFGLMAFLLLYVYTFYAINNIKENNETKIYHNKLFWYCLLMIVLLFFMMESEWIWTVVPKIMLNIQFPWRLWALLQLFVSIIFGLVIYHYSFKKIAYVSLSIIVGLFIVTSMPLIEKRSLIQYGDNSKIILEENLSLMDNGITLGFNKEYIPQVLTNREYKSEYNNSLYYYTRYKISGSFNNYEDYSVKPVFLKGNGNIVVDYASSPNYQMSITTDQQSLIQMPLIYYPGYKITITDLSNQQTYTISAEEVDGFIAFNLDKGNYKVTSEYKGTITQSISKVYFTVSIILTSMALIYGIFVENEKYKKYLKRK